MTTPPEAAPMPAYVADFLRAVRSNPGGKYPVASYYPPSEPHDGEPTETLPSWKVAEQHGWVTCNRSHTWTITPAGMAAIGALDAGFVPVPLPEAAPIREDVTLLPCPWCGPITEARKGPLLSVNFREERKFVACGNCGAKGPSFPFDPVAREDAASVMSEPVAAWNRLAHTARPGAGDEVERVAAFAELVSEEAVYLTGAERDDDQETIFVTAGQIRRARAAIAAMREGVDRGMVERLQAENAELRDRGARAVLAYHVAICSPKGVVPDDSFYDPIIAAHCEQAISSAAALSRKGDPA